MDSRKFFISSIEYIFDMDEFILDECLCHRKERLFRFFEEFIDLGDFIESRLGYLTSCLYELTKDRFIFDDLCILEDIRTREYTRHQICEESVSSHRIEFFLIIDHFTNRQ